MNQQGMSQRRGATVNRIPYYPHAIHGSIVRQQLQYANKCPEVTEHDKMWQQWLATLVKQGWIMQTQFGQYARPRSSADRALAYHRRRRPEPGITLARQLAEANQKILKEMSCVSYRGVIK